MRKLQTSGPDGRIGELVFSTDSRFLVALSSPGTGSACRHFHVWQLPDGASSSTIVTTGWDVIWGRFGSSGSRFIASGRQLGVIDLPTGESAGPVPLPRPWTGVFGNVSRDGRYVIIAGAGGSPFDGTFQCGLALARVDSLHSPDWVVDTDHPSGDSTWFLAAGDHVAAVEYRVDPEGIEAQSFFVVRTTNTGEVVRETPFSSSDKPVQQPALSPDDRWLINPVRNRIDLYAVAETPPTHSVLRNDNRKHFTGIAFHPSGRYLAATSNDTTVKLYDTASWAVAKTYTWDVGRMRSVAFSPDGTLAAAGSDTGKVVVWDVDV